MTSPFSARAAWTALAGIVLLATLGHWISARHLFDPNLNPEKKLSGDEIVYLELGEQIWWHGRYHTRDLEKKVRIDPDVPRPAYLQAPLFKHPPLFPFLVGLCRRLIARTIWAAFIPSLVMGAASIVGLYALARGLAAGRGVSLLAAALLSASPTHWICSSRIWLDATLTALIVWAAAALVRGDRPRWMWLSGVFWGLAFLVKYTAFAAWAGAIVAALLAKPEWRRSRKFWAAQALAFLIFAPWVLLRFAYDGWALFAIRNSNVEDWRSLSSLLGDVRIWVGAAVGCAALFAITRPGSLRILREVRPEWIAALALLIAVTLAAIFPDRLTEMPWSGWGSNEIANSPRWFYLARPLLFEPVVLWGCLGMLWAGWDREWHLARGAWLGLFIFLTAWGNFQMRYGMPLLPFEHLFAAALLGAAFSTSGKPFRFTAVLIVAVSLLRSAWVISGMAIDNKFFYF